MVLCICFRSLRRLQRASSRRHGCFFFGLIMLTKNQCQFPLDLQAGCLFALPQLGEYRSLECKAVLSCVINSPWHKNKDNALDVVRQEKLLSSSLAISRGHPLLEAWVPLSQVRSEIHRICSHTLAICGGQDIAVSKTKRYCTHVALKCQGPRRASLYKNILRSVRSLALCPFPREGARREEGRV